jgi:hypothetical protein
MNVRNSEPVSKDTNGAILFVILGLIVFCAIFLHIGTQTLRSTRLEGSSLILGLSDGHEYEASACKNAMQTRSGNEFRFIAFGFDLSLFGKQITMPVIIHCELTGWWVDDFVLPTP